MGEKVRIVPIIRTNSVFFVFVETQTMLTMADVKTTRTTRATRTEDVDGTRTIKPTTEYVETTQIIPTTTAYVEASTPAVYGMYWAVPHWAYDVVATLNQRQ